MKKLSRYWDKSFVPLRRQESKGTQSLVNAATRKGKRAQDLGEVPCVLNLGGTAGGVMTATGAGAFGAAILAILSVRSRCGEAFTNTRVISFQRIATISLHEVHKSLYSTVVPWKVPLNCDSSLVCVPLAGRCSVLAHRSHLISTTTFRPICPSSILRT